MVQRILILLPAIFMLGGCATPSLYYWGDYESALYRHYKTPGQMQDFGQDLEDIITEAETDGRSVPPGVYAEYAYVMMQMGHPDVAVKYYKLEKRHWPKSTKLMNAMISTAHHARPVSASNTIGVSK